MLKSKGTKYSTCTLDVAMVFSMTNKEIGKLKSAEGENSVIQKHANLDYVSSFCSLKTLKTIQSQ